MHVLSPPLCFLVLVAVCPVVGVASDDVGDQGAKRSDRRSALREAVAVPRLPTPQPEGQPGKSGIDRFTLDTGKVRESRRHDGTIIVQLNGEGMEKLEYAVVDGVASIACESMLETRSSPGARAPVDFRTVARSLETTRAHR